MDKGAKHDHSVPLSRKRDFLAQRRPKATATAQTAPVLRFELTAAQPRLGRSATLTAVPIILWELRGQSTGTLLCCNLLLQSDNCWRLTVAMGENRFHIETFVLRGHAIEQSEFLYRDFIREGWTEVFKADPL